MRPRKPYAVATKEAEVTRTAALDAAKARCTADCGPIGDALRAATDDRERTALVELEHRTHAAHKDELEEAYLVFSGQRSGDSNPSGPEGALTSHVAVISEADAGPVG